jgi:hypothetical protein
MLLARKGRLLSNGFMATISERITQIALDLLKSKPEGIRYGQLVTQINQADPYFNKNTINGTIWDLDATFPDKIYKPSRGLFRLTEYRGPGTNELKPEFVPQPPKRIKEGDFYSAFADWLVNDLEECTKAISLGGNQFRDKWGTPDVLGKRESRRSDIVQAPVELVAAEVKLDMTQLVTAFGQACGYCLFARKSYLVIPAEAPEEEIARTDALCLVFGIGLVLFDNQRPDEAHFQIRVRPQRHDPDMFYVNKYMKSVENELFTYSGCSE